MICSILSIPQVKLDELEEAPKLTAHERSILRDIVEILLPFEEATDLVQTEHIPSTGYVLASIKGLKYQLEKLVLKYHSSFVRALKTSFESRMTAFETNKTFILGAKLDPCFKFQWCADNNEKQNSITLLKAEVAKVTITQEQEQPPQPLEEPPAKNETNF